MKPSKKLNYILMFISGFLVLLFIFSFKQKSKAADLSEQKIVSPSVNKLQNESFFVDPLKKDDPPKFQPRTEISPRFLYQLVQTRDFRLTGESNVVAGKNSVHLVWDAVPDLLDGYVIERTNDVSTPVWDTPPVNYGKHVKILNVYPDNCNYLKQWMDQIDPNTGQPVSMGLISVEAVSLTEFNKNANYYLKKGTSTYQYDGVYFGSEDVNGGQTPGVNDLTAASQPVVADFGATGRSVIFGHDTIFSHGFSHPYMNTFASKLDLFLCDNLPAGYHVGSPLMNTNFTDIGSPNVAFTKDGFLNRYPYNLDPTKTYLIKPAHTVGQFYSTRSNATKWMEFKAPLTAIGNGGATYPVTPLYDPTGTAVGSNNWYLVTKDNYAQIQTGHTTGSCSPDEAKIIANMIYYTSTLTTSSPGDDHTVKDKTAPNQPTTAVTQPNNDQVNITVNSDDNATDYYYRVKARTSTTTKYSDVVKFPVLSGLRGYIYTVDSNPNGVPTATIDPATGLVSNINLNPNSSASNQANISFSRAGSAGKYFHVVAVDNANNVSAVKTINLSENFWWNIDSAGTLTIYPHELNWERDRVSYVDQYGQPQNAWPWYQSAATVNKSVISAGVTAVGSIHGLFNDLTNMTSIIGLERLNTSRVTDMSSMFSSCRGLTSINVSNFDTSQVTSMDSMFSYCSGLQSLDVTNFVTTNVIYLQAMFYGCSILPNLDVTRFNTSNVINMSSMFGGCKALRSINVTGFDTSKVTDMGIMFSNCQSLTSIDVSSFDTSNVTNMTGMFAWCKKIINLEITNFDTSKVTDMSMLFYDMESMVDLKFDVNKFKTTNVRNMKSMFERCTVLKSLDVSKFDTTKVTNMENMFSGCAELTRIDVKDFKTEQVANFGGIFKNCSKLTSLDLTNFNTKRVYSDYRKAMLANTPELWKITFGPNFILEDYIAENKLSNPRVEHPINDLDLLTPVYYVTNPQWREVGTNGNDHEPAGPAADVTRIMNESGVRSDTRTYVWDQIGTQTLAATPESIDFGVHEGSLKNQEYTSSAQNLKLTDNRNNRTMKRWYIEAAVTKPFKLINDASKAIRGNPLYYHENGGTITQLTPTAQTIFTGTGSSTIKEERNYPWTLSFKAKPSDIPSSGQYVGEVTFTLVNITP
ncbi:BspA family leucine-rich repeat surface protein [Xylocopilactobacillus apicola]|uniref:Surface protein n=1 Tax=Xylocopilactobacillus apicola TaxID=2932184 RepID=A0AAU9DPW2_9LACO|nr:BspA family leucine-rich repeat surface protein [Xylocopilactobacillus apicola]BDR59232.1 hypothetical protein XA3_16730 [Xylocopilactobacillus apicola]